MTHERDLDRVLDRWMDDGPTIVADRVIATAMTDVHTTRQRGAARLALLKELLMIRPSATIGVGLVAAAVLAIAALQLFGGLTEVGSPAARGLEEIVVTNENAPEGWTVDATLRDREVLAFLIRYGQESDATDGFVEGRATDFCAEDEGCGTAWVARYGSEADADAAFSVIHGEMQVGWGLGAYPRTLDFGEDEGYAYRNTMGNASATHAYVWRQGNLLLGVVGDLADLHGDPIRPFAEGMNARSR